MVENLIYIVAAYLIGSVPFGYLAGRMNGLDLREHGSRNIGATNAVRVLGKKWGIPVFVCDFLKGYLPLLFMAQHLGGDVTTFDAAQMGWFLGVLFALVLGHTFTCYLNFKGGKGVATTGGCLFAVSPIVGADSLCVALQHGCRFGHDGRRRLCLLLAGWHPERGRWYGAGLARFHLCAGGMETPLQHCSPL